ncbi:HNH endonuclease [Paenibacillus hamazuiensis]|uniref:HNH endonuclease n=1 Tax=Paenibacillus hamazuiensis TaxID=2936508 RepID=UPI0020100B5B|nr:HNH endonuclease [Paenibacillus hamazuiensis]
MSLTQHPPPDGNLPGDETRPYKTCAHCLKTKPLTQFDRRAGRRSGKTSRRGTCRSCQKLKRKATAQPILPENIAAPRRRQVLPETETPAAPVRLSRRPLPLPPPKPAGPDPRVLRLNRSGIIWMRGKTDKGRRWQQETDLETAVTLVKEYAAVVVNRHTIRRIYSNKSFRRYILERDRYTCYFCGEYGDTIDHLLPRSKGGHTTPVNCVCACNLCNQSKANRSLDEFMGPDGE